MKFLFIEPFFGGSHRDFAEGLCAHSAHAIDLLTMPDRFWKWRMRGAALHFAPRVRDLGAYDGLIASGLMSLSDFRMLTGATCPPVLVYLHENQITYPLPPGERRDVQFGFTDVTTALAADRILFNSRSHFETFFAALPRFIAMMPEHRPFWVVERLRAKAGVLHPGCRFPGSRGSCPPVEAGDPAPPLIVWNHRWEFDKDPGAFFDALYAVADRGLDFRLALLGRNYASVPKVFAAARERLGKRIVRYGFAESRRDYRRWLAEGTVVVSTARQENFGIAVVEAVRHGCLPLLPDRLSYPEVIPARYHGDCLYGSRDDLVEKLSRLLRRPGEFAGLRRSLAAAMARFSWEHMAPRYDAELEALAGMRGRPPRS